MTQSSADNRNTFTTQATSRTEIRELLEGTFVSELLMPSESVWLVSPWITDIDILDFYTNFALISLQKFKAWWYKQGTKICSFIGISIFRVGIFRVGFYPFIYDFRNKYHIIIQFWKKVFRFFLDWDENSLF